jgi:hypothetical protein
MTERFDHDSDYSVATLGGKMCYLKCNFSNGRAPYRNTFMHTFVLITCFIEVVRVSYYVR